jgi:hypothetical protein
MAKSLNYLSFPFGETTVTLAEDRGKLGMNQWGEFFSRNFLEPAGKFSCCSPDLERLIVDSGAKRGSVISVVKEKYGASAIWRVKLLGTAPTPITATKTNGHANGHATPAEVTWANLPSEKYAAAQADAQLEEKLRESIAMVEAAKENVKAATPAPDSQLNLMARCGCAAVDAALAVQAYAASKGLPLKFNEQSISAWSSTMYINAKNGDR